MPITDPSKIIMAVPGYKMDQIIGVITGSFNVTTNGNGQDETSYVNRDTTFGTPVYTLGLWSPDGGTTWFDLNASFINGVDSTTGQLSVTVRAYVGPTGQLTVTAINSTKSSYNVQYKIALLARMDQGQTTPTGTNQKLSYKSGLNYMKIIKADIVTVAKSASASIPHGQNGIPNVACWVTADENAVGDNLGLVQATPPDVYVDGTNLTLNNGRGFADRNYHYVIYLDK